MKNEGVRPQEDLSACKDNAAFAQAPQPKTESTQRGEGAPMRGSNLPARVRVVLGCLFVALFATGIAASQETVLLSFNGMDGGEPSGSLTYDAFGNLYGTTYNGGAYGLGAVFELGPAAGGGLAETLLYSFAGYDGANPLARLIIDAAGNLYGTTSNGGTNSLGVVFELTPFPGGGGWYESAIYSFAGPDGAHPQAGLILDPIGNLYGTASQGGATTCSFGCGTVFTLTPTGGGTWNEKVLHRFGGKDGSAPLADLIFDAAGNLYGTTHRGGAHNLGTVFELTGRVERVLHSFNNNGTDGIVPTSGLIFDTAGNLYGTTYEGGHNSVGTVFELKAHLWTETVLYNFGSSRKDGTNPSGDLIFDGFGNLYGVTLGGGMRFGTIFQLAPTGAETVLYAFTNNAGDGAGPATGLVLDPSGNLYGATSMGGSGFGTIFQWTPAAGLGWKENLLVSFGGNISSNPSTLIRDAAGNFYGTTSTGGASGEGTVFELYYAGNGGWKERVIHSFDYFGQVDGFNPAAGLLFDAAGNLYGTTLYGGNGLCTSGGYKIGCGTVFELTRVTGGWKENVLYNFHNDGTDGVNADSSLLFDTSGNLYGTTFYGGGGNCLDSKGNEVGCGVVFELTPIGGGEWSETLPHTFANNGTDGVWPGSGLSIDPGGNLYGMTRGGGVYGGGTVFELANDGSWTETLAHSFGNGTDGSKPLGGLAFDNAGNLYGTTETGGANSWGTAFELTPSGGSWTETVLHSFNVDGTDGILPYDTLIRDPAGNLYGTTAGGGMTGCPYFGCGVVFELTPVAGGNWTETVIHSFSPNSNDGDNPVTGLIFDGAGNLYGTTSGGGTCGGSGCGTVFEIRY